MNGIVPVEWDAPDIGPWFLLGADGQRTFISARPPLTFEKTVHQQSTDVHFAYFKSSPWKRRNPSARDYFGYAVMEALRTAASATPIDNEFWSILFPARPGNSTPGVVRMTYVSEPGWHSPRPQLMLLVLPSEVPALQLIFSARRAFVPATLQGLTREILGPPSRLREFDFGRANPIPLGTTNPVLSLPAPVREAPARLDLVHVAAFQRLRESLPITDDELADIVGVGRTTPYKWMREGTAPKPKTLRHIMRLDAIVRGLQAFYDADQLNEWLVVGTPSPLQLLRNGTIDAFERLSHTAIFKPPTTRPVGYDVEAAPLSARTVPVPSIAPRRAKVSLPKRDR
jgi:transcriptional regulator with XRE-family HTH domain